ncbi:MAG: ATP-binding cassette domain-containing protein, partial [Deltaproteobacteria bacterium]|nr:ATP-binding cassette domain-containing protein [Deltaproteobacteria bacterium]
SFGGRGVLAGVELSVLEGSTCVVLGGSGSGRTVLLKHLVGLLKPDLGEVRVDGEDIVPLEGDALAHARRKFGMVFQGAALFDSVSAFENVASPLREHARLPEAEVRARVHARLELLGLSTVDAACPSELSGGMRKRVGLARAVITDPKIVLYDGPTTGLDPLTTDSVEETFKAARAHLEITSVVISHDISFALNVADQVCFLHDGRIVEPGPPGQVRNSSHPAVRPFLQTWFGRN